MTDKEISELKRRIKPEKCCISHVYGCMVNQKKEIESSFKVPLSMIPSDDAEMVLAVLRKTLSGTVGKNIIPLPFTTEQVMDSDEHRLLMAIRNDSEEGDGAVGELFLQMAHTLLIEGSYLILFARDSYDLPAFGKDGAAREDNDTVFRYVLCSVCPIKDSKAALGFFPGENTFRSLSLSRVIAPPELGFLFPSFNNRQTDIYGVTYFYKGNQNNHPEMIEQVLKTSVPLPAVQQKETFGTVLEEALSEDCSLQLAVKVRESMCDQIAEYKADKEAEEAPVLSRETVKQVLTDCGVSPERVSAFEEKYNSAFGQDTPVCPQNLVDVKTMDIQTPDVSIKINNDRTDLVQTRMIDGVRYILIRAENGVQVNGMNIQINE